jgi:muconate cycloisomerase
VSEPRIERVECVLVDLPTIRPHVLSMTTLHRQTLALVRIHASDGVEGIGEATTIGGLAYGEESPEGVKTAIDAYFAPLLIGEPATRPAPLMRRIEKVVVGNRFAKCAVETALLDAQGRRVGLPVSELLGGRLRDSVPVLWTLASGDTGRDIAEAQEMLDRRRHDAFKLKIGKRTVTQDVAHVAAIKAAVGDRASVRVDVNMAWDEAVARRGAAMLAHAGCDLIEQPIAGHNRVGMARLRASSPIPIMADEALRGPETAYDFAASAAADVFAVKIEQSGGLAAAKRVQAIAEAAGVAVYGGTMLEAGVGTVASAQAFATFPELPFGTELFGPLLLTEEILAEPLAYGDFALSLPNGPGLGVALDEACIDFHRRDRTRGSTVVATGLGVK